MKRRRHVVVELNLRDPRGMLAEMVRRHPDAPWSPEARATAERELLDLARVTAGYLFAGQIPPRDIDC